PLPRRVPTGNRNGLRSMTQGTGEPNEHGSPRFWTILPRIGQQRRSWHRPPRVRSLAVLRYSAAIHTLLRGDAMNADTASTTRPQHGMRRVAEADSRFSRTYPALLA